MATLTDETGNLMERAREMGASAAERLEGAAGNPRRGRGAWLCSGHALAPLMAWGVVAASSLPRPASRSDRTRSLFAIGRSEKDDLHL